MDLAIQYQHFNGFEHLNEQDQILVQKASYAANHLAYAPYSHFHVGAAILLANNEIVLGSNQENASSPAGICAERTALSVASSLFPKVIINTIAIYYTQPLEKTLSSMILSPCGICRQSLMERAHFQKSPLRIIMTSPQGAVNIVDDIQQLLPFAFSADFL